MAKRMSEGNSAITKFLSGLPKVMECKSKMIERDLVRAKAHCPACDGKNTLQLALAINRRDRSGFHIRWFCKSCDFSGME